MTDEQKALVARLRDHKWGANVADTLAIWSEDRNEAADMIEVQAAENARLRAALYRLGKAGQAVTETFTTRDVLLEYEGSQEFGSIQDYGTVGKNLGQELMAALMQANEAYGEVG
jgi:hypothetical protein